MTKSEIREFENDARKIGGLAIHARDNDPELSQENRKELVALVDFYAGCLNLARALSATSKKGAS